MVSQTFEDLLIRRLDLTAHVLGRKSKEYATADDRLYNFKRAGTIIQKTPIQAAVGMWSKHLVSVIDILERLERGMIPTQEEVDEKFGDSINYHILIEALIHELRQEDLAKGQR